MRVDYTRVMSNCIAALPLSLYIHLPWCIKKCPYCDFNSHTLPDQLPEESYVNRLLGELAQYRELIEARGLHSIFIGGGTPSLFSGAAIRALLEEVAQYDSGVSEIEITMEANPGTVEQQRFVDYREAGVNRLSLGVQSFQDDKLSGLGRIHDASAAHRSIDTARSAGFDNVNVDLMFGLAQQTVEDACYDLNTALEYQLTHLSWYQLTLEPNTVFYKQPPSLPSDEQLGLIEVAGLDILKECGYQRYEVSAFSQEGKYCRHNENYWLFGDYLGIGAGAHSKLSNAKTDQVMRIQTVRNPQHYMQSEVGSYASRKLLTPSELCFEFMLNALRLYRAIPWKLFTERTGIAYEILQPILMQAHEKGLLTWDADSIQVTQFGRRYLNDLTLLFLLDESIE